MDLTTRIRRRQQTGNSSPVIRDYEAISPVAHIDEPAQRGPTLERLLDYLDPVFDGHTPTNAYVWGATGTGKSAIVTALFTQLSRLLTSSAPVIHTSTRAQTTDTPAFIHIDTRRADSPFGLYHALLDSLLEESIPEQGVKTEALRTRVVDYFRPVDRNAVVAVDHLNEPGGVDLSMVAETIAPIADSIALVGIGRRPSDEIEAELSIPERIEVPPYEHHALVEILTARSSGGLTEGAISHEQLRRLANWADGNAHDALAALFCAADFAEAAGYDRLRETELTEGMNAVPQPSAALGRVHTLQRNRQLVLRRLIDLPENELESVDAAADAIVQPAPVDLSSKTVQRFLYELAESGIIQRVPVSSSTGAGRPPSRLEPRFPTPVFRRLYDLDEN